MAIRQSSDTSFAWLSFRSRATIPSRLAISCLLLLCATSQPFLIQSAKLTLISNHEEFLFFCYRRQEMIFGDELFAKLARTVHGRVEFSTQLRLNLRQRRNHIGETYLTHDHEVHIARRLFLASCNRTIHERKANPTLKRTERFVENVSYSRRLGEDAFQLCEDGVLTIRLVIDLTTTTDILDESGLAQLSQFALGCAYSCSCAACDFA